MARYQIINPVALGFLDVFQTTSIVSNSSTSIVINNTDGTITTIAGVGLFLSGFTAFGGTMTSITRTSADGLTTYEIGDQLTAANNSFATFWNAPDYTTRFNYATSQSDTGLGSSGNDVITLGEGSNTFFGFAGNDLLIGGSTIADQVNYGSDANRGGTAGVVVNLSNSAIIVGGLDVAAGTAHDGFGSIDTLVSIELVTGTAANDYLVGNAFDNSLTGGNGNDVLIGGDGYDFFTPGAGADIVDGSPLLQMDQSENEKDTLNYSDDTSGFASTGVIINLSEVQITGTLASGQFNVAALSARDWSGATDVLIDIERVRGTNAADYFRGSDTANFKQERFAGLGGNDFIDGGAGFDQVDYRSDSAFGGTLGVSVNLATQSATDGFGNHDTLANIEGVIGTTASDVMIGDNGRNSFRPLSGNDTIDGGGGRDIVDMYFNDDFVGAGATVDLSIGIAVGVFGGVSTLTSIEDVYGSYRADTITGSFANNYLYGDTGNDSINGLAGNDLIEGGPGNNILDGGDGIDVISYLYDPAAARYYNLEWNVVAQSPFIDHGVTVNLATHTAINYEGGTDTITNFEDVLGTFFNDTLTGDAGNNTFGGLAGNDLIDGGDGQDTVFYGTFDYAGRVSILLPGINGSDPNGVVVNLATHTASDGEGGTDTLTNIENVIGSRGNDTLIGDTGDNSLAGLGGNDILDGGTGTDTADYSAAFQAINASLGGQFASGADIGTDTLISIENINGGAGNDTISGDGQANVIVGNGGDDLVFAGDGADNVSGGDGNDTLVGNTNQFANDHDTLDGGAGNDIIHGEAADTVIGGAGQDFLYSVNDYAWNIDLGTAGIEWMFAGFGNDVINAATQTASVEIYGGGGSDTITGSAQDDFLWAGGGNDIVVGGDGADLLFGDLGADSLSGGAGNDRIYVDSTDTLIDGGAGFDAVYITSGPGMTFDMAAQGIEWVADFAGGNDILNGAAMTADMTTYAGGGNDIITGGAGNDFLWGEAGDDTITGGSGGDVLVGGIGADVLTGGAGIDVIYLNSGGGSDGAQDTVVFTAGWGTDFVFDFVSGEDKLDLTALGTSFAALTIANSDGHAYITIGAGTDLIAVAGNGGLLTAGDFLF